MTKCLYCYKELTEELEIKNEYHQSCSKKFFGTKIPPKLEYSQDDMLALAEKVAKSKRTVTGVKAKLSLGRKKKKKMTADSSIERFTIVGLWGKYILKP